MNVLFTKAKLEGWAQLAEIGGAVAVIVSVIYLGRQNKDNTSCSAARLIITHSRPSDLTPRKSFDDDQRSVPASPEGSSRRSLSGTFESTALSSQFIFNEIRLVLKSGCAWKGTRSKQRLA
jgi:hypothetical protein